MATFWVEFGKWSQFVRENFDKLLLCALFGVSAFGVLHLVHHGTDAELVLWGREIVGTILGALLGLITGHALAQKSTISTPTATAITETKQ